jgi:hypothetical protein
LIFLETGDFYGHKEWLKILRFTDLTYLFPNILELFFLNEENENFRFIDLPTFYPPKGYLQQEMTTFLLYNLFPILQFYLFCKLL